jgi:hypothetical protein
MPYFTVSCEVNKEYEKWFQDNKFIIVNTLRYLPGYTVHSSTYAYERFSEIRPTWIINIIEEKPEIISSEQIDTSECEAKNA